MSSIIYNLGIQLYGGAAKVASLWHGKAAKMVSGQRETMHSLRDRLDPAGGYIWIHAASLGEFEQGRPLIERLRREHPDEKILLTFFSPSGYEVRKNYPHVDAVAYLPFDTPRNARRFVEMVKPRMAIFVKYEFWGNYLQQLSKRGVPTYIISAIFRPGQIFFKPWGGEFRKMLKRFDHLYLQDEASRQLLEGIGVTATTVAGDTRFDRVTDIMATRADIKGIERFGAGKPKIVFGSSWEADEERYMPWLNSRPDVRAIIAPHEFDASRLEALRKGLDGKVLMLSEWERMIDGSPSQSDIDEVRGIIVDSFGKLSTLYRYGDIAYVGGGFGVGIHNINEAAVYGMPVVFGPKYSKFKEARDLIALGGAYTAADGDEVRGTLSRLVDDPEARAAAGASAGKYIADNLGATDIIHADLFSPGS